jgi:hypothetical protein
MWSKAQPLLISRCGRPQGNSDKTAEKVPYGNDSTNQGPGVKAHRGDPLNEEADIRAELGRLKEQ